MPGLKGFAELASVPGHTTRAAKLRDRAEALRQQFEAAFWCEGWGTYAQALRA